MFYSIFKLACSNRCLLRCSHTPQLYLISPTVLLFAYFSPAMNYSPILNCRSYFFQLSLKDDKFFFLWNYACFTSNAEHSFFPVWHLFDRIDCSLSSMLQILDSYSISHQSEFLMSGSSFGISESMVAFSCGILHHSWMNPIITLGSWA